MPANHSRKMQKRYRKLAKISLALVYLVIIAGAVVRMTGSGMGCPDWPKCFGYYIPPTDISELQWQENRSYKQGQVIIRAESLWVAKQDFRTNTAYNGDNWTSYDRHNYAVFNPFHTWTEYINRLAGALAGLATLLLALYSLNYWKERKTVTLLSFLVVVAMGFQAWLGATVVYSVLEPVKITIHMIMALVIVALLLYLIKTTDTKVQKHIYDRGTQGFLWVVLCITLIQVVLGTQVRQFVDDQIGLVGENAKNQWLQDPQLQFYVHRSFSVLVVFINVILAYRINKRKLGYDKIYWVLVLIFLEAVTGMAMYYLDFPLGSQPMHLVLASLLFGVQFYLVLEAIKSNKTLKSL